jgi:hypothetical protein
VTRAALLPAGGDPFLTAYWLRHYRTWADEVDELIVNACDVPPVARPYLRGLAADLPNARIVFTDERTDHGEIIGRLIEATKADYLLLMEDDAFIRQPDVVNDRFTRIELGEVDAVGTCRGNANPELIALAENRWGPSAQMTSGETGLSLYPCLYFGRRSDLLATDRHFGAWAFAEGDNVPGLDVQARDGWGADTFVGTSWQLRNAGLRIQAEPGYRTDRAVMGIWGAVPWFHVGSLSSGYGSAFMGPVGNYRARVEGMRGQPDWTKRVGWWQRAWECWDGGIPEFHQAYGEALERFVTDAGIDRGDVAAWRAAFDPLISWPERP